MSALLTLSDIEAAAVRIEDVCVRTPIAPLVAADADAEMLWLKAENLQPTGAFKLRGATNAVRELGKRAIEVGVVTHSSGNHGQALAYAARVAGAACTVVVPKGAPRVKLDGMRRWGARLVEVTPDERDETCAEIARTTGAEVVLPFDDARIIAGQGTVGLEIVRQRPDVRTVWVPVGGGGLISGISAAVKGTDSSIRVIGVEPEAAGDAAESFARGERVAWSEERVNTTVADGLRSPCLGELTWAHVRALVDDIVTVSEEQIENAVGVIARQARLVAEPSGAVATAGWLAHRDAAAGPSVAVLSGGNVDPARLAAWVA